MRFRFTARPGVVVIAALLVSSGTHADGRNSATVSLLEGTAKNSTGGNAEPAPVSVGSVVYEKDVIYTSDASRLELKMKDGSVLRVGPSSKLELKSAYFADGEKKFSAKLFFGKVWSKVSGLVGTSTFEVETDNAVAGVRGTTFRVDASSDKSVLVRVYAGTVAMNAPGAVSRDHKTGRHQVPGPSVVSRGDWEKIVTKQMEMRVAADGTPSDPVAFTPADDKGDEWAAWNAVLDSK
jgi:hypothetical protein